MLWLATAGGASALNRSDIGSIKTGNSADFAIYDMSSLELAGAVDDPVGALIFCGPLRTKYTICNGKVLSEGDEIKNINLEKTILKHNQFSKNLLNP